MFGRRFGSFGRLLFPLRRWPFRRHEGGKRTAFAAHDDRGKAVEPRCTARFDADRLREIDIAAIAREGAIIPVALAVLDPDAATAVGAPVADRAVAGEDDAGLDAERARFLSRLGGRRDRKSTRLNSSN